MIEYCLHFQMIYTLSFRCLLAVFKTHCKEYLYEFSRKVGLPPWQVNWCMQWITILGYGSTSTCLPTPVEHVMMCICSTLFRNLRFLQKALFVESAPWGTLHRATQHSAGPNSVGRPTRVGYCAADTRRCPTVSDVCRPHAATLYPTRVGRPTLFGPAPCRVALMGHGRNGSADLGWTASSVCACARSGRHSFYRLARFLGIPRKRSAFCRKRRTYIHVHTYIQ